MKQLSIILPYYKRIKGFTYALQHNQEYFMPHQIVVVLDEPTEAEQVLAAVKAYTGIQWTVIKNRNDHPWRNPSKAINVGIRHARCNYVLVMSPESVLISDLPAHLLSRVIRQFHDYSQYSYAVGLVRFLTYEQFENMDKEEIASDEKQFAPYGSICTHRSVLAEIGGYDETNVTWGVDDINIRARLKMKGLVEIAAAEARLCHVMDGDRKLYHKFRWNEKTIEERLMYQKPLQAAANFGIEWGRDFDEIIYDTT